MKMKNIVIYRNENSYCNLPDIIRLKNGDLLAIFREAPIRPRWTHHDPWSMLSLIRSTDDGQTWDPLKKVVIAGPYVTHDVNLGAASQISDGSLIISYHRWVIVQNKEELKEPKRLAHITLFRLPEGLNWYHGIEAGDGMYMTKSKDGGRTWGSSERLNLQKYFILQGGKTGVIELSDHTWLLSYTGRITMNDRIDRAFIARSKDQGKSWESITVVADDPRGVVFPPADETKMAEHVTPKAPVGHCGFFEPSLLRLPNGKIIALLRTGGADGHLYQSNSLDDGETWSPVKRTPIWGCPPHLLRLRNGRILCTYSYRRWPYGVRGVFSDDGGGTWDIENEIVLRRDGFGRDLGYPASVQLNNDSILTIYWFHGDSPNPTVRYIAGTIWEV